MDIEAELKAGGFDVIGPAHRVESAERLIDAEQFDAALLDANLNGFAVDDLAGSLARKGIPFAFVSGYGREALPVAFRNAELLPKPFPAGRLLVVVHQLLHRRQASSADVVSLRPGGN